MLKKISNTINTVASWFLMFVLVAMMSTVVLQVLSRYIMKVPFPWVEELARYLMIWVGFLGSSIALREGAHISITFLLNKFDKKIKYVLLLLVYIFMVFFFIVLTVFSWKLALFVRLQKAATLPFSMFWAYAAIPIGSLLMMIQTLYKLINYLKNFISLSIKQNRKDVTGC